MTRYRKPKEINIEEEIKFAPVKEKPIIKEYLSKYNYQFDAYAEASTKNRREMYIELAEKNDPWLIYKLLSYQKENQERIEGNKYERRVRKDLEWFTNRYEPQLRTREMWLRNQRKGRGWV